MSNLTLQGSLGGHTCIFVQISFSLLIMHFFFFFIIFHFLVSTSHDQKIVVLDFSAGLDVKLFV